MPMTPTDIKKIRNDFEIYCYKHGIDPYVYDLDAKVDLKINFSENWSSILDELELLTKPTDDLKQKMEEQRAKEQWEKNIVEDDKRTAWFQKLVISAKTIMVIGSKGSGKSALAFHYLDLHHNLNPKRQCCTFLFPKPNLLPSWIINYNELEHIPKGAVCLMDEVSLWLNQFSAAKQEAQIFANNLKILRQKRITALIITQNDEILTRDTRRLIDFYLLRKPNQYLMYESKSLVKKLYQNCFMRFLTKTDQMKGYFISDFDMMDFLHFDLPLWWTEKISHAFEDYQNSNEIFNTSSLLT